jgi:hypothetical protein
MKGISLLLVAVAAVAGFVASSAAHLDEPMERLPQSSESRFPLDTATGS